tara:strand:+ start:237 stop:575 length:339 start_codon:yes stop_codon:yes gene_type:complete
MNKQECKKIREDLMEMIQKKYGKKYTINNFGGSYTDSSVTYRIEFVEEKDEFSSNAFLYGLKPEDYGKTFKHGNKVWKLVGFKSRSPKYAYICEDQDGNKSAFTKDILRKIA